MTVATQALVGRQDPTYLWVPPYEDSLGLEFVELSASAGLVLDPWQDRLVDGACALAPNDMWLCFEVAWVVSRQNGKGAGIQCLELGWLFLLHDELVIHSAHLFETSREHFLKMQALIDNHDDFRRRVRKMREGRGSEEIELIGPAGSMVTGGSRLKFMTRKGGAGRGFTANKNVFDEAMYLDADMMAASLPTLSTIPNAQVVYAGSAGMRHSTQLGLVRRRGLAGGDPSLMYAEFAAEKPEFDRDGHLVAGDDPADIATHLKTNPCIGLRRNSITLAKIANEMRAFGGPNSPAFWQERLGIGDWPEEDESWEVIGKQAWDAHADEASTIPAGNPIALVLDTDPKRSTGTIGACGLRADGRRHFEIVERHRGTGWMLDAAAAEVPERELTPAEMAIVDRMVTLTSKHRVAAVIVLKTAGAASLITALERKGLPVHSPSEQEYAQACGQLYEAITELDDWRHLDQASLNKSIGGARKREGVEGGWRWSRSAPADAAPIVCATLATWGLANFSNPEPMIFI